MITEFTCGIYKTTQYGDGEWGIIGNGSILAIISENGENIRFLFGALYATDTTVLEFLVLMNNIKRQYKQLRDGSIGNG